MRIYGLVVRIIRQFFRDKRSLALMFGAPVLVLWLLSLVFASDAYKPKISLVNVPAQFMDAMKKQNAVITEDSEAKAKEKIKNGDIDGIIQGSNNKIAVTLEGSDPSKNSAVLKVLQQSTEQPNQAKPDIFYYHGSKDFSMFDSLGPVLIGFFSFFFVFLLSGIAFIRERLSGTLERLLSTPIRRWEIVIGYIIGFGIFAILQSVLIVSFSIYVLNMYMIGSIWSIWLTTCALSLTALTLGTFLSAYANNEFQMIQFIPLIVVPQLFFSGLFPIDSMSEALQWLGKLLPLTYGADAMREIMIRNEGFGSIAGDLGILFLFSLVFAIGNVFALKKHRRI
ncbi:ABC transporter permease [Ectobacillus panaciterrae]|uniref:ABC transporter permease n=1 Tax=Ectobacillus panaciterrae TaxID=363872 RepID=UPI0003F70AB6|nr:ABC transporter permease [Ectobacillus panaciterrae]